MGIDIEYTVVSTVASHNSGLCQRPASVSWALGYVTHPNTLVLHLTPPVWLYCISTTTNPWGGGDRVTYEPWPYRPDDAAAVVPLHFRGGIINYYDRAGMKASKRADSALAPFSLYDSHASQVLLL